MTSRSDRARRNRMARRWELAVEFRRLVQWYKRIAEDFANAIQARLSGPRKARPWPTRIEIQRLEHQQRRAERMAVGCARRADHYETAVRLEQAPAREMVSS